MHVGHVARHVCQTGHGTREGADLVPVLVRDATAGVCDRDSQVLLIHLHSRCVSRGPHARAARISGAETTSREDVTSQNRTTQTDTSSQHRSSHVDTSADTRMWPRSVNLTAFPIRFTSTCPHPRTCHRTPRPWPRPSMLLRSHPSEMLRPHPSILLRSHPSMMLRPRPSMLLQSHPSMMLQSRRALRVVPSHLLHAREVGMDRRHPLSSAADATSEPSTARTRFDTGRCDHLGDVIVDLQLSCLAQRRPHRLVATRAHPRQLRTASHITRECRPGVP
eukprot:862414-Rhodomonas_salina.2